MIKTETSIQSDGGIMLRKLACSLIICSFLIPGLAGAAVTDEDLRLMTTQDLVDLCTVSADDPRAKEAIGICFGYLVGAYDFYKATNSGKGSMRLVCMPNPPPSRSETVSLFVEWAKANPQYMKEAPVETEFRFLSAKWPCKN